MLIDCICSVCAFILYELYESILLLQAYFSDNSLTIIRTLITGGFTPELEYRQAEGLMIDHGESSPETLANRLRCRMIHFSLGSGLFQKFLVRLYSLMENLLNLSM